MRGRRGQAGRTRVPQREERPRVQDKGRPPGDPRGALAQEALPRRAAPILGRAQGRHLHRGPQARASEGGRPVRRLPAPEAARQARHHLLLADEARPRLHRLRRVGRPRPALREEVRGADRPQIDSPDRGRRAHGAGELSDVSSGVCILHGVKKIMKRKALFQVGKDIVYNSATMSFDNSKRVQFLNSYYDDLSLEAFLDHVDQAIARKDKTYRMVSLNLDQVVKMDRDPAFREAFNSSDYILMDGVPLVKFARSKGMSVKEKVSGSDLIYSLCEHAAQRGYSCFFLGGREGVPEAAATNLSERYPGLQVAGSYSPPFGFEKCESQLEETCMRVSKTAPDICFVCLGEPKQTMFAYKNANKLNASFVLCLGAAIDFAAGSAVRAPKWMQDCGLEWLYRFMKEPRRLFKRYFVDSWRFLSIVKRYPIGSKSKSRSQLA